MVHCVVFPHCRVLVSVRKLHSQLVSMFCLPSTSEIKDVTNKEVTMVGGAYSIVSYFNLS